MIIESYPISESIPYFIIPQDGDYYFNGEVKTYKKGEMLKTLVGSLIYRVGGIKMKIEKEFQTDVGSGFTVQEDGKYFDGEITRSFKKGDTIRVTTPTTIYKVSDEFFDELETEETKIFQMKLNNVDYVDGYFQKVSPPIDQLNFYNDLAAISGKFEGFTPVNPAHYKSYLGIEVIDVIESFELNFNLGNVCKYVLRAGRKDPKKTVEDLKKAVYYLNREINNQEKIGEKNV